jgi:DNA-binding PadR family transcriptional regulator
MLSMTLTKGKLEAIVAFRDAPTPGNGSTTAEAVAHLDSLGIEVSLPHLTALRQRMEKKELVIATNTTGRKRYVVTDKGYDAIEEARADLERMLKLIQYGDQLHPSRGLQ